MAAAAQRAAALASGAPASLSAAANPSALSGGARRPGPPPAPAGGRRGATGADPGEPPAISEAFLEDQRVEGLGSFRAYEDGRVRALFDDRTILYLEADHASARLTLPDGTRAAASAANPVGVEGYVSAALQFATWAFRTPAERGALLRAQALVQVGARARARACCCSRTAVRARRLVALREITRVRCCLHACPARPLEPLL